jgi:hypothetical protein
MKRRRFVEATGGTISLSILSSNFQRPAIALDFDINSPKNPPRDLSSILIKFDYLKLIPLNLDESKDLSISINLNTDQSRTIIKEAENIDFKNGRELTIQDIIDSSKTDLSRIYIDGLDPNNSILQAEVEIEVRHPDISNKTYSKSIWIEEKGSPWIEDFSGSPSERWDYFDSDLSLTSNAYKGNQALFFGGHGDQSALARRDIVKGGAKIGYISFWYYEASDGTGHGIRLKNSNGDYEVGGMTDNPQFSFDDASGIHRLNEGSPGYKNWTNCKIIFNWDTNEATIEFSNNSTGSETGNLKEGVDIETVELWTYSSGTWGRGQYNQTNHWDLIEWDY